MLFAAAVVMMMTACGSNKTENNGADSQGSAVVELTDDNAYRPGFTPEVPTILDFNATWCGPCQYFKPVFHQAAEKFKDIRFVSVDVDKMEQTAAAYSIEQIPTVILVAPDGSQTKFVGTGELLPPERFDALCESLLK